ncbi:hypothetical protein ASU31_00240 [Pedobacter ginsenosidimutans]|uniref:DUF1634 domain-containing protein n=1 Tax=Pedobacter ginsenosidimutans TaxID=687842 RepID=A0A0T5VVC3_9SPHI|nr:DUF1634 domain-containing protein [Pedobacter ginsenosidimutans]KRT17762.1 hypothetical protein ASU31_00240 [Pedobacter ginsenosidimutans]
MNVQKNKIALSERDVEKSVGQLLRFGVVTSSIIVLIGGILYLFSIGSQPRPDYDIFKGEQASLVTFKGIFMGIFTMNPMAIIQFGALLLIMTPIMRIIFSLTAFAIEKDRLYVIITLIVLSIILVSTFGGLNI